MIDKCHVFLISILCLTGCWRDIPPDRIFKSAGHDVAVYSSYEKIASRVMFARIVPERATDIWICGDSGIGGQNVDFRCRITPDEFQAFAKEHGYSFQPYDLNINAQHGGGFCLHDSDSAIFSHFPLIVSGEVLGHHPDGFFGFSANEEQKKRVDADWLKYVYDTKCGILWGMWWN